MSHSLSRKQIEALSDAHAFSGQGQSGLTKVSRRTWSAYDKNNFYGSHDYRTIRSLLDRGYLKLWLKGSVAHITDSGIAALEEGKL